MNAKFILFSIAGLGSLMMFYMWYNISSTAKDSQATEEQYNYRITNLKSEIEVEKKLMESLRKDVKSYSQNIQEKSSLIDKMNKKGLQFDRDKVKLEKEMDTLRMDLDKLTKSSEEQKRKIESETDEKQKEDNAQIDSLESEIKKLQIEKDDLKKKQNIVTKPVKIVKLDSPNDNVMQGKPPKIKQAKLDKINYEKKEEIKSAIPIIPDHQKPKDEQRYDDQKDQPKNNLKIENQSIVKPGLNKGQLEVFDSKKTKLNENIHDELHMNHKEQNSKPDKNVDFKQTPIKNRLSNIRVNKDDSQLFPPVKDLNNLNQKDKSIAKPIKDEIHQLKPPKNDKEAKGDVIQYGNDVVHKMKKDIKID